VKNKNHETETPKETLKNFNSAIPEKHVVHFCGSF
jgi:hypothetical protein